MKTTVKKRVISVLLTAVMLLSMLPVSVLATQDEQAYHRVADGATMDAWQALFPITGDYNTENVGKVWTDKSVFTDAGAFAGNGIAQKDPNSFLVALSAMASSMFFMGSASAPTDTVLILDISGSMNDGQNDVAEALVEAANESIHTLLKNTHARVGVVLYSGSSSSSTNANAAITLLPLGRYTTGSDGVYLNYTKETDRRGNTTEYIDIDGNVARTDGALNKPNNAIEVVGATYIQKGLHAALQQFLAADVTVNDTVLGTVDRIPVVVLMSDGAPSLGDTDFTAPGQYKLGSGSGTSSALGFVTQLTAAYVKAQINAKYNTDCLFYTLGLGLNDNSDRMSSAEKTALSVLDPGNAKGDTGVTSFWQQYNDPQSTRVQVETVTEWIENPDYHWRDNPDRWIEVETPVYVQKIDTPLSSDYVDRYFSANAAGSDLSASLKAAFEQIVGSILLRAKYFPTLVERNEDLSGYVSFIDRVGEYMQVTDLKGILIHNQLFSGATLASNFAVGASGGSLGTISNPTEQGRAMMTSVRERLGLPSDDAARTVISLAYDHGQLYYNGPNDYSNYIGWYANAVGEYLGFWYEGMQLPAATGDAATDPYYIIRSYGYLGAVDAEHGVSDTDLLYAVVQLRERVTDAKEQTLHFSVPAALIPVVDYQVTLDENNECLGLKASGATAPIRLVYEVALRGHINPATVKDVVSPDYLAQHTDASGNVAFYSNRFEADNTTGYGKVNPYSYFNPSRQNSRYYFTEDSYVYTDTDGTLYRGDTAPDTRGTYYYRHVRYGVRDGRCYSEYHYGRLSAAVLATVKAGENGSYYVPAGDVHVYLDGQTVSKNPNVTATLPFASQPYVDTDGHEVDESGYSFIVGATLGNNGKLALTPATGIKISKQMADGVQAPDTPFTFTITRAEETNGARYEALYLDADGKQTTSFVTFENGQATVLLKAGQTVYIHGMQAGNVYTVAEQQTAAYLLESINGVPYAADATVTVAQGEMTEAIFVNTLRGQGDLTVSKVVSHGMGNASYGGTFTIRVTLRGIGTASQRFAAKKGDADITVSTDANGVFTATLAHNEQLAVFGLPAGTVALVQEQNIPAGFTATYYENDGDQQPDDGEITVKNNDIATVAVLNTYAPQAVTAPAVTVGGTKQLVGRDWLDGDTFTFVLERQNADGSWTVLARDTVSGTDADRDFAFANAMAGEQYPTVGSYNYRIVELEPQNKIPNVTYDKTIHSFTVQVTDADWDGALEIAAVTSSRDTVTVTAQNGSYDVHASITNTYWDDAPAVVTVEVGKLIEDRVGSTLATPAGFRFVLQPADERWQPLAGAAPILSAPTNNRGATRFVLTNDTVGTYRYILSEQVPDPKPLGWQFTAKQVQLIVEVTRGQGSLQAVVYRNGEESGTAALTETFTNIYQPQSAVLELDFVQKRLEGARDLVAGEFDFVLEDANGALRYGKNDANGKVQFIYDANGNELPAETAGKLTFDKTGVYIYRVREISQAGGGVTPDQTVYDVLVTVTDNGGALQASHQVENVAGSLITFVNRYQAQPVTLHIPLQKQLRGRVMINNEFTFVLTETDGQGNPLQGGRVVTVQNGTPDADNLSKMFFPALTFDRAGTYYFTAAEQQTAGAADIGITHDAARFAIVVTVTDHGDGTMTAAYTVDGQADKAVSFVNVYDPEDVFIEIIGLKQLEGKLLGEGDFSFELYRSNAAWEQLGDALQIKSNAQDGTFVFDAIDYDTVGDAYYLIGEVGGGRTLDGVVYDNTVFRVHVRITDDLVGRLHAVTYIFDQNNVPQSGVQFINRYLIAGDATVTLQGTKTVEGLGRLPGADRFAFELFEADAAGNVIGTAALQTVKNDANGNFSFALTYLPEDIEIGTFYYLVTEQGAGTTSEGITNSEQRFLVTVTVEDDGVGGIKTIATVTEDGHSVASMDFVNTYKAQSVPIELAGEKQLIGRDLLEGEFAFLLYHTDDTFATDGVAPQSVRNGANGSFAFDAFTATEAGRYYFVLREDASAALAYVTYDTAEYRITVTVGDDGRGNLTVDDVQLQKVDEDGTAQARSALFVNTYEQPLQPETGRTSNLLLWFALLVIGGGLTAMQMLRKKEQN